MTDGVSTTSKDTSTKPPLSMYYTFVAASGLVLFLLTLFVGNHASVQLSYLVTGLLSLTASGPLLFLFSLLGSQGFGQPQVGTATLILLASVCAAPLAIVAVTALAILVLLSVSAIVVSLPWFLLQIRKRHALL